MKKFLPTLFAFIILFSIGQTLVHAQGSGCNSATGSGCSGLSTPNPSTLDNPFNCGGAGGNCTLGSFLNTVIQKIILPLGGILAVLAFIWTGFMYVTARGNSSKLEEANRALLYVAIGTAVLLGATLISAVISNTVDKLR